MEDLLDIDSLSEQDRDIILQVLKRDDEVRKTQELKANQLKVEIQSLRMQSVLRPGDDLSKMCARCHYELGFIFNRGDICPRCRFRVCNHCKETMFKGSWLCNLCFKQRQLKLLTGEWAGGPSSGLRRWASGTDIVKASIIYKDHPPLARKQDVTSIGQSQKQVLQMKQGVVSSSNTSGPRAIGGQEIRKSPAKAANNKEVQKEHTNGVVSAQETERVEYPKETDKQRLSQLLNFIRAKKPLPVEAEENSREMSVRRITSRNYSVSSESSSSETDDDIGSSFHPSLRSSSVSPPISEVEYDVQMSESARLQSVHEEHINTEGDGRHQVVEPELLEQLTLELSPVTVPSRDISPKEQFQNSLDHQLSNTEPDVNKEERHVKQASPSLSDNASAKINMITTQSYQPQWQTTAIQGDCEIQSRITSADLPLGRSSSPISVSMDSLPSSHPSPSMSHSNTADLLEKGSIHDTSDAESISRAYHQEMTELSGTESVVREGSTDDEYVLEEISKVKFRRISQPSKHSEGKGPRYSHSPQIPSRPEGFTAEVEGPRSYSGLQKGSEQFEEGRKETECRDPFQGNFFNDPRSETAGKVSYDLSIEAVDVDTKIAQDSEIKLSQLSQLKNITSTAIGTDPSPNVDQSTYSNAHPHQFTGSHLSYTTSLGVHGSCIDVVNSPACDNLSGVQSSFHSHLIKHKDISNKDYKEITKQKGSERMTLLDVTIPAGNHSVSERSVSEADSIGSFNLSPMSPISPSSLEANTGVYTIAYFDSDDALEDPAVEAPENDDYIIQWTEDLKSARTVESPQILKLDKGQNRSEVSREIDTVGIKEKIISACSGLWHVQGVDTSKKEFDSMFNQEEKIMKSSKGGYLTRSSSEDSDELSIIDEKDEEEENRLEDGEERKEIFLCKTYLANEGGMSGALQPNSKPASVCKKQQSHFLDIPEIRDPSSVVFAEHSVKINQEVSNEFISLDPSSVPDVSLDDILAVNRNMSAVGDSDDGDLEEILAYYRDGHQESSQAQLPKAKKSSTSDTDIRSLDISHIKKAIKEKAAEKQHVYLSGVSQNQLTVFAGKDFSSRCLVEPSILNEVTCIRKDAAKSDKMETLQHPTEVTDIKENREDDDEMSMKQVRNVHPDKVIREYEEITLHLKGRPVKEEKQIYDITEVHPFSEFSNKLNLFSDLKIEDHKFSENLHENCCSSPTDQINERQEQKISVDQNSSERLKNQIPIDQETRITPHKEEVDEQVEQVANANTATFEFEMPENKLPQKRAIIEEITVVQDPEECERTEKSFKKITETSGDYLSLEGQMNSAIDSAFISEQMFVTEEPFCIDYVIQPPEEFSDAHMATSSSSQHVASQQDADYLSQHQASQQDADYPSQHQASQQDADYPSHHQASQKDADHPSQHQASQKDADYLSQHQAPQQDADYPSQHQAPQKDADYPSQHQAPQKDADYPSQHQAPQKDADYPSQHQAPQKDADYPSQHQAPQKDADYPNQHQAPQKDADYPSQHQAPQKDADYPSQHRAPQKDADYPSHNQAPQQDADYPSQHQASQKDADYLSQHQASQQDADYPSQHQAPQKDADYPSQHQAPQKDADYPIQHQAPQQDADCPSQHQAPQKDADYPIQHQAPQQDADYPSQHQAPQKDADYMREHVPDDDADAEIRLILKDPQTLEKVETLKRGENWDDMYAKGMKAEVVLTLSSDSDNSSKEFFGKIGEKETSGDRFSGIPKCLGFPEVLHSEENIVSKIDLAFHPPQNLAEPQDVKDDMFSFQESSSKACFTVPMIDVDVVETEKRTSPLERSESSTSQEDSGHVSLPTSVGHTPEHKRTDSGYSQSSIPSTATDRSEEEDIDKLVASAKSNIGSRGNLLSVIADSRESIVSYYSDAGDISHSNIPVTGEVLFGLNYNYKTGMLEIAVKQCKDVAPADTKRKRSDPYVKTYLLPDKTRSGKRKTKVKKHTLSPIFDEVLKYSVSKSELENRTLWLSVWHNDRFGRNDFLGEVTINFDYYKFDDPTPKWYPLQERMDSQQPSMLTYKGDLILSICFVTTADNKKGQQNVDSSKGQLHVMIKEAHNLTAVRSNGYSDPFCKGYMLPDRHRSSKQKTPVVKRNCNPVWNYKMVFDNMSRAELAERCLELTIWDHEKLASNDFLGGVRLNLGTGLYQGKSVDWMDSKGEEISLWQAVLDRPNLWIQSTLILRPNMQKRKF
ncbi:hypothetical protein CHS0354_022939 [Potamilus streckersoni]|uniref:Synaptotagmin-like protein 5 n=1 Tax=Potamilus streckersoni TaxID=2493646 RepID=A0AAE0S547_9BIVA|nr:hypothetical protein CHS0354_022939 [Potamilus streckersoni]